MVFYNKDDMTNYSKHLGLNKVAKKKPNVPYYSENDIHEVSGEMSGEESVHAKSAGKHGYMQRSGKKNGEYDDDINGRVKIDSWNMNYMKRKKKHKKKKVDANMRRRMDELEGIYGVDARTLAGIEPNRAIAASGGKGEGKGSGYDDMSLRST